MAVYAIGDVQGCVRPLAGLLEKLQFDPAHDRLWLAGDLINRGPDSEATLQFIQQLGDSVIAVLGNHDLHFLAVDAGLRPPRAGDTFTALLQSPARAQYVDWLRTRPLVHVEPSLNTMMVHAGIYPGWRCEEVQRYAGEVEKLLRGADYQQLLANMYGREPQQWQPQLRGWPRYRFIINALTRMRFCRHDGRLDFYSHARPGRQPRTLVPWYEHPAGQCQQWRIVFGHWSTLGYTQRDHRISLDSGCVWGGQLTAVQLDAPSPAPYWQWQC